ncbi:unnamed protein product [Agarophyton chilense]
MSDGLAGYHRAPNHHYPPPRATRPTPIVQRSRFKIANPRQPVRSAPPAPYRAADDWMILKLDEDLSDHDKRHASDDDTDDDEHYDPYARRACSKRATRSVARAPCLEPQSAPSRAPNCVGAPIPSVRRRKNNAFLPHTGTSYGNGINSAFSSTSRKRRPIYTSSDSESDDE